MRTKNAHPISTVVLSADRSSVLSPAGFISAASTLTPNNRAAATHLRGPGPSLLRYMRGPDGAQGATTFAAGAGAVEFAATGFDESGGVGVPPPALPALFLAILAAFLRAFLLGPVAAGFSSCVWHGHEKYKVQEKCEHLVHF